MKVKFLIIVALLFGLTADTFGQQKKYKYKKNYRKKAPYHKVYKPKPKPPRGAVVVLPPGPRHRAIVTPPTPPRRPARPPLPPAPPRPPLPGRG